MKKINDEHQRHVYGSEWFRVFVYASLMFGAALTILWLQAPQAPIVPPAVLAGFVLYSLFTITAGYRHPYFGHVAMDRAGQIFCLLSLGPFHAAWISGLSYFLFSWGRLRRGVPLRNTINAVLVNTGMMSLMLLLGGYWYQWLGGEWPLTHIDVHSLVLVVSTLLVMQSFNDLTMAFLVYLRGGNPWKTFAWETSFIEMGTGMVGMTLALVLNRQDFPLFLLVLIVISIGMLVLKQYASIRLHLEALVRERTEALEDQAQRDPLTGLSNRRHTDSFLRHQIEHAKKTPTELSVVILDIDHFKKINDRYLHATGDKVLQHLARLLSDHCRQGDLTSRYGGEEFLICFPMMNLESSRLAAEKLRLLTEQENWEAIASGLRVTISLGVAQWQPGMSVEDLIHEADQKLYEAKAAGRNKVCY